MGPENIKHIHGLAITPERFKSLFNDHYGKQSVAAERHGMSTAGANAIENKTIHIFNDLNLIALEVVDFLEIVNQKEKEMQAIRNENNELKITIKNIVLINYHSGGE